MLVRDCTISLVHNAFLIPLQPKGFAIMGDIAQNPHLLQNITVPLAVLIVRHHVQCLVHRLISLVLHGGHMEFAHGIGPFIPKWTEN
jgi:hypothetical protein